MPATPHTIGGWIGGASSLLVSLAVFGRLLVLPGVRAWRRLVQAVDELHDAGAEMRGVSSVIVSHEIRIQTLEGKTLPFRRRPPDQGATHR